MSVTISSLERSDLSVTAALHRELLDTEFLSRCGSGFLRHYHRAWIASPDGIGLCAKDASGTVLGVLLGALHPESHYRAMLRHDGLALAGWLGVRAMTHPSFAYELLATRARRYSSRLWRIARSRLRRPQGTRRPPSVAVGEVVHLMVHPDTRGQGIGRRLLDEMAGAARAAGCKELILVTPTDLQSARSFYEHLGWQQAGEVGKAGERFVRYRMPLS